MSVFRPGVDGLGLDLGCVGVGRRRADPVNLLAEAIDVVGVGRAMPVVEAPHGEEGGRGREDGVDLATLAPVELAEGVEGGMIIHGEADPSLNNLHLLEPLCVST